MNSKRIAFGIGIVIAVLAAFTAPTVAGPNTGYFVDQHSSAGPDEITYVEIWVNITDPIGIDPDYTFDATDVNVTFDSSICDIIAANRIPGDPWDSYYEKHRYDDSWWFSIGAGNWTQEPWGQGPGLWPVANLTIEGVNPGTMDLHFSRELPRRCNMFDALGADYPNQIWEDGTFMCGAPTYTISGTVPGVDTVNITNMNTSVEYVAEVAGNEYTLTLDVPGEVEAGNKLLIVACDVPSEHESNCNVTNHTVETAPGEETVDLTLNHYCLNYYPDYPYYTQEEDNWSGPAVMKACIAHYIVPPTQAVLNDTGIANNHVNHAGLLYVDPRGMETTMDSYLHPYHNYGTFAIPAVEDALHRICYWQKLGPGAVPAYGDYSNWMAVRGIHTSKKPTDYSAPYDYEVYGFWVNDPNPSGIGENSYKTATEFTTDYYIPTIDLQVPVWNDTYMSVLEPPEHDADITIVAAKPRLAEAITPMLAEEPMMLYGVKQLAHEKVVKDDELLKIVQAAIDGVNEELVPYDTEFAAVFAKTVPGKPMLVSRDNGNYYVVPFNMPVEIKQTKKMPVEIERPKISGLKKLERMKRVADRIDFKPIPIEPIRVEKTLVVVLVNAADGSFKEASWVEDPEKYLPVSKIEALKLALGEVLEELHVVAKKDARDLGVIQQRPTIELVYRDASPYYPDWKVTVNGKVFYVGQDGTVSN